MQISPWVLTRFLKFASGNCFPNVFWINVHPWHSYTCTAPLLWASLKMDSSFRGLEIRFHKVCMVRGVMCSPLRNLVAFLLALVKVVISQGSSLEHLLWTSKVFQNQVLVARWDSYQCPQGGNDTQQESRWGKPIHSNMENTKSQFTQGCLWEWDGPSGGLAVGIFSFGWSASAVPGLL